MAVVSDPIADLLTCIRNAANAQHRYVDVKGSRLKLAIVQVLKELGYISNFMVRDENVGTAIRVFLKYGAGRRSLINGLQRCSTPGRRLYIGYRDIPSVLGRMGAAILSTPKGVMTGKRAVAEKLGGELLCKVW
jgi:small subunit ribosomal protein S8